jgi:ribosomal protein S12 methylthiotransferase accessory factor
MQISRSFARKPIELFDAAFGSEPNGEPHPLSRLYNRHLGPLTALRVHRPELSDFSMYTASCEHALMSAMMPDITLRSSALETMLIPGGGKGRGMSQPVLSALGEASERLLAVLHFQGVADRLEFASHDELERAGQRGLGPEQLPLFAPEQYAGRNFRFQPFHGATRLGWHEATDLLSGEPIWVPAQLALLYYKFRHGEPAIGYPTSGGLGFAASRRGAILHGLYEFMERDAINLRWFCRLAPPRVEVDAAALAARLWPEFDWRLSTYAIKDIGIQLATIDHPIPILTMTAQDVSRDERAFLGAGGAGGSRERALAQVLFELAQTRSVLNAYQPKRDKIITATSRTSEMTDFLDGTVYFGFRENIARLDWYTRSGSCIGWEAVPHLGCADEDEEYEAALLRLRKAGLNPVVIDLGSACWPGAHLVRVIIPEMTLACVAANPYLGHPRYYELPRSLGLADRRLRFGDLNPDPIPFP